MDEKTNVMRFLDQKKIKYISRYYDASNGAISGTEVANALNEDVANVFKTLVCVAKSGEHYVFDVPVDKELDLKKAAKSVGEKSMEMLKSKDLLPLTGYIHGGCSPIGMKKFFKTTFHSSVNDCDVFYVSGGKIGTQIGLTVEDLKKAIRFSTYDIVVD